MTVRALLATALAPLATPTYGYALMPYARALAPIPDTPVVMLRLDQVKPGPEQMTRRYEYSLVLVTPLTDAGPADDDLDLVLEDVLHLLDTLPDITWNDAKRGVYADANPAYEVAITVHPTHGR